MPTARALIPSQSSASPPLRWSTLEEGYAQFRLLSIDVALAALAGGIMACRVLHARPHPAFFLVLPLSVWVFYTLDHLLDARRMGESAATPRHQFHRDHFVLLSTLCAAAVAVCGLSAFLGLSWLGVEFGLGMVGLCLAHELLVKLAGARASPLLMKELGVAVIFTAGAWGLPWMIAVAHGRGPSMQTLAPTMQYLLLALVNLIEFSMYERRQDAAAGQTSFVLGVGRPVAGKIAMGLLMAVIGLGLLVLAAAPSLRALLAQLIFAGMASGLAMILIQPRLFARRERYRLLGDGVFLLPVLMILAR